MIADSKASSLLMMSLIIIWTKQKTWPTEGQGNNLHLNFSKDSGEDTEEELHPL